MLVEQSGSDVSDGRSSGPDSAQKQFHCSRGPGRQRPHSCILLPGLEEQFRSDLPATPSPSSFAMTDVAGLISTTLLTLEIEAALPVWSRNQACSVAAEISSSLVQDTGLCQR